MIKVTAWKLHLTDDKSDKFYDVFVTDRGHVILNFGRRSTMGQVKIESFTQEEAGHIALRQVYAKASKGYKIDVDSVEFVIDEILLDRIQKWPASGAQHLQRALEEHLNSEAFRQQQRMVNAHYDKFISEANTIMTAAAKGTGFEALLEEWQKLQEAWKELDDKHQTAQTVVNLVQQTVAQSLMGAPA